MKSSTPKWLRDPTRGPLPIHDPSRDRHPGASDPQEPMKVEIMAYDILYCALCGKNYNDVNKLITEDGVTLCDVCYTFCAEADGDDAHPPEAASDLGDGG